MTLNSTSDSNEYRYNQFKLLYVTHVIERNQVLISLDHVEYFHPESKGAVK